MHGSIIYNVKGYPSRVPFHPDRVYPEFSNNHHLEISDSPNLVYDSVRRLFLENSPPKDDEEPYVLESFTASWSQREVS